MDHSKHYIMIGAICMQVFPYKLLEGRGQVFFFFFKKILNSFFRVQQS